MENCVVKAWKRVQQMVMANCKLLHFVLQWTGATDTKIRLQLKPLPTQNYFGLIT